LKHGNRPFASLILISYIYLFILYIVILILPTLFFLLKTRLRQSGNLLQASCENNPEENNEHLLMALTTLPGKICGGYLIRGQKFEVRIKR